MARVMNLFSELVQWWPGKADRSGPGTTQVLPGPLRQLELLLPFRWPESDLKIRWCVRSGTSVENQGTFSKLDELNPDLANLPLVVFLDPLETAIIRAKLPAMSRKNLARAIPYALEDRLLGDVDEQFFVPIQSDADGSSVCVIAHERMQAILATLNSANLTPTSLSPVMSAVPLPANSWTLVFNDQSGCIRTGESGGMAVNIESMLPPYVLKKSLQHERETGSAPTALLLINAPAELDSKEWSSELQLEVIQPEAGFWENLGNPSPGFNLLQGPYKPKSTTRSSLNRLRLAIVLILVLAIGNIASFGIDWFRLYKESRTINSEMMTLFKTSFPDQANAVIDPALQMQRNLDRLRQEKGGASASDFLALLLAVSKSLSGIHAQSSGVNKVRYADKSIVVDVQLADYQNLDRLKQVFMDNHLSVQVLQAESGTGGVQARLKLEAKQEIES